jgi:hypothetical protein
VRWMLTRWSPNTVIRLVELPIGGNWMKVALSLMTVLRSSARSVIIQSSFLGRIAVSREMMPLLWQKAIVSGAGNKIMMMTCLIQ